MKSTPTGGWPNDLARPSVTRPGLLWFGWLDPDFFGSDGPCQRDDAASSFLHRAGQVRASQLDRWALPLVRDRCGCRGPDYHPNGRVASLDSTIKMLRLQIDQIRPYPTTYKPAHPKHMGKLVILLTPQHAMGTAETGTPCLKMLELANELNVIFLAMPANTSTRLTSPFSALIYRFTAAPNAVYTEGSMLGLMHAHEPNAPRSTSLPRWSRAVRCHLQRVQLGLWTQNLGDCHHLATEDPALAQRKYSVL